MKRKYFLALLLCVSLCLAAANIAIGETQPSAKQLFLTNLSNNSFDLSSQLYPISSGISCYEVKRLETNLPDSELLKQLNNAKLDLNSKLDSPAKKAEVNYTLNLSQKDYNGSLFMDSDKIIMSTEFMDLIKDLSPAPTPANLTLPSYIYLSGLAETGMWDNMVQKGGSPEVKDLLIKGGSPEVKDLLIFIVEAIPENYFQFSSADQKIVLKIDQDGSEQVLLALLLKGMTEKERFAGLLANAVTANNPTLSAEEIKQNILEQLQSSQESGDFAQTLGKIQEVLGDQLVFELTAESSLLPSGPNKFLLNLVFNDGTELKGNIYISTSSQSNNDAKSGNILMTLNGTDIKKGISVDGKISVDFSRTLSQALAKSMIELTVKDSSAAGIMLDLSLQGNDSSKSEKSVAISIPELTPANSMDITEMIKTPAPSQAKLKVILDGEALSFDVDPFIKEDRTFVPLRNLAEKLGFTVNWLEPNQVIMNKGGTTISMFLGEQYYTVNGSQKYLDVSPFETGGRTMVPVRFIAEELDCMVDYSEASNTVFINHK